MAIVDNIPPNSVNNTRKPIDNNSNRRCMGTFGDHSLIMILSFVIYFGNDDC